MELVPAVNFQNVKSEADAIGFQPIAVAAVPIVDALAGAIISELMSLSVLDEERGVTGIEHAEVMHALE